MATSCATFAPSLTDGNTGLEPGEVFPALTGLHALPDDGANAGGICSCIFVAEHRCWGRGGGKGGGSDSGHCDG